MRLNPFFAAGLAGLLLGIAPAMAESGGGPVAVDIRDEASAQIEAVHAEMVQRAAALGAAVATRVRPGAVALFQYPLKPSPAAMGFAGEAVGNHVDHDGTAGLRDFACGTRTYDGHQGTDIFLWPYFWTAMDRAESRVVAALPGVIVQTNDGAFDRQCQWVGSPPANYVIVRHDNGLLGYYWHLKKGSVTRKGPGARVALGEQLGSVGSSGFSTGPHLHFEVRDGDGAVVDPYAGACGADTSGWTHQVKPVDPALLRIATHAKAPPTITNCGDPDPGYANRFQRGATVYAAAYLRDQLASTTAIIAILRPDGSVAASYTSGAPPSSFWEAAYLYTSYRLPADAPLGEWRVRVSFVGKTSYHAFVVGTGPKTATITAAVSAPVRTVSVGKEESFTVEVRNRSANRALGCRLSLWRPINADVAFRQLDATGTPTGLDNVPFAIPAKSTVKARLTVTPRAGFEASRAEFPLVAKCMNSATAAFSRDKTMLTLTGGSGGSPALSQ